MGYSSFLGSQQVVPEDANTRSDAIEYYEVAENSLSGAIGFATLEQEPWVHPRGALVEADGHYKHSEVTRPPRVWGAFQAQCEPAWERQSRYSLYPSIASDCKVAI